MSNIHSLTGAHPLKTVLCDMGNVLVYFCHDRMCRQIGELCGRSAADVQQGLIESLLQWEFERGQVSEQELLVRLENVFDCRLDLGQLVHACSDIFELNTSMVPVLAALKQLGLRLVLLSNTCVSHINFIRSRWTILEPFDYQVLSCEVGAIKPEEAIYQAALQQIHCEPAECLYLDDIPSYVEKGRSFGLCGEVYTSTARLLPVLQQLIPGWNDVYNPSPALDQSGSQRHC